MVEKLLIFHLKTKFGVSHHTSNIRQHRVEERDKSKERDQHGGNVGDQRNCG